MKKIILLFFGLCTLYSFSQRNDIAVFKITNYSVDGQNFDDVAIDDDLALIFYYCEDTEVKEDSPVCFTNLFRNSRIQSGGRVTGLIMNPFEGTEKHYAHDDFQFTWDYFNTFNNATGQASVKISQIYTEEKVNMTAEIIILDTNEVLEFVGYLEE